MRTPQSSAQHTFITSLASVLTIVGSLLWATSCLKSEEPEISLHTSLDEDTAYKAAYDKATSRYEVINNFETRFTIQSTLLSNQFRGAFAARYQRIYNEEQPVLNEASQKTGFFVSVYTANNELADISDLNLWSIQLLSGNEILRPIKVEKLSDKDRWRPFFGEISPWSHEYLVLFDTPAPSNNDQDLVVTKDARLVLSNQDGRVTITW